MSEATLMRRVACLFADDGYTVALEVPFFERRLDLVAIDPHKKEVTVVEGKVNDWRRGVGQLVLAQTCAHRSFLAVSRGIRARLDEETLRRWGIGLISVDGVAQIELSAPDLSCTNDLCVRMVSQAVMDQGGINGAV